MLFDCFPLYRQNQINRNTRQDLIISRPDTAFWAESIPLETKHEPTPKRTLVLLLESSFLDEIVFELGLIRSRIDKLFFYGNELKILDQSAFSLRQ